MSTIKCRIDISNKLTISTHTQIHTYIHTRSHTHAQILATYMQIQPTNDEI